MTTLVIACFKLRYPIRSSISFLLQLVSRLQAETRLFDFCIRIPKSKPFGFVDLHLSFSGPNLVTNIVLQIHQVLHNMSAKVSFSTENGFPTSGSADAHRPQDTPLSNFTNGSREEYRTKAYQPSTPNSSLKLTNSTSRSLMLPADSSVIGRTELSPTSVTFGPSKKIGDKKPATAAAQQITPSTPNIANGYGLDHTQGYLASLINNTAMMPTPPVSPPFSTSNGRSRLLGVVAGTSQFDKFLPKGGVQ